MTCDGLRDVALYFLEKSRPHFGLHADRDRLDSLKLTSHFKVLDNRLYIDFGYFPLDGPDLWSNDHLMMAHVVLTLLEQGGLPDVEFLLNGSDFPAAANGHGTIPVLGYCTTSESADLPVPFAELWQVTAAPMAEALDWNSRAPLVYFRGEHAVWSTLPFVAPDRPRQPLFPRHALFQAARGRSWADIWLTGADLENEGALVDLHAFETQRGGGAEEIEAYYNKLARQDREIIRTAVDPGRWADNRLAYGRSRYCLGLDGVTFCGRLGTILRSGALLIRNKSPFECVVSPLLEDGVNCRVVEPDGRDLVQVVEQLLTSPDGGRELAERGRALAARTLSKADLWDYMRVLLEGIADDVNRNLSGFERMGRARLNRYCNKLRKVTAR